jgi:hypothetical protein
VNVALIPSCSTRAVEGSLTTSVIVSFSQKVFLAHELFIYVYIYICTMYLCVCVYACAQACVRYRPFAKVSNFSFIISLCSKIKIIILRLPSCLCIYMCLSIFLSNSLIFRPMRSLRCLSMYHLQFLLTGLRDNRNVYVFPLNFIRRIEVTFLYVCLFPFNVIIPMPFVFYKMKVVY